MPMPLSLDRAPTDPLNIHFGLKACGSSFAAIARRVSTPEQPISSSVVRATVYGTSAKHRALILSEIRRVLSRDAATTAAH